MRRSYLGTLALFSLFTLTGFAAPFTNGDFENPGGTTHFFGNPDTYANGWTHTGSGLDSYSLASDYGLTGQSGDFYITFGHSSTTGGMLSQSFDTLIGHTYNVIYYVRLQQNTGPTNNGKVEALDASDAQLSQVLFDIADSTQWVAGTTLNFTANSTTSTLRFTDMTSGSDSGPVNWNLDSVSVQDTSAAAATPEPVSYALVAGGLALAGMIRQRARR